MSELAEGVLDMRKVLALAALCLGLAGQAHAQTPAEPAQPVSQDSANDPLEPVNRAIFGFNETVDKIALEPVAKGYRAVTPRPVRTGVSNVLSNLRGPLVFINDVLQGQPKRAGTTAARFALNSTAGVLGIFDVGTMAGFEKHDEDFGQTLGVWGVGSGPFLMLPLLGPSNLRDTAGQIGDVGLDPVNYANFDGDGYFHGARFALGVVSARADAIEVIDQLRATSIDPYVTIRTSYTLLRESSIHNGETKLEDLPDFQDEPAPPATDATPPSPPASAVQTPQS